MYMYFIQDMQIIKWTNYCAMRKVADNGGNKARLAYAELSSYHKYCSQMGFIACYRLPFINRIINL